MTPPATTPAETPTLYLVGISGGKDSSRTLAWSVFESGLPKAAIIPFACDTGNEAPETYAYIKQLSDTVCIPNGIAPILWIHPALGFFPLAEKHGRFPSVRARFCTKELKIDPTTELIAFYQSFGFEVVLLTGVRRGESFARSKYDEHEYNDIYDVMMRRPILLESIEDVRAGLKRYGIRPNPLYLIEGGDPDNWDDYDLSGRVGCYPCVLSNLKQMRRIGKKSPEVIDNIRLWENRGKAHRGGKMSFFTPGRVPLRWRSFVWETEVETKQCVDKVGGLFAGETITTPAKVEKRMIALCMIDDAMAYAESGGVEQTELDLPSDLPAACADRWGLCE